MVLRNMPYFAGSTEKVHTYFTVISDAQRDNFSGFVKILPVELTPTRAFS